MNITMLLCLILAVAILLHVNLTSRHEALAANAQAEARSAFLANMSHEIRTPLNGIIGLIYLINRDIDDDCQRPAVKQRLSKMQETADYLLSIINNILDLSKLKSGKVALNQEPVSPEQMADDIYAMQKNNIEERGIAFLLEKDIPIPQIIGDEILIKRVLMNIVGNAAKFTPKGGTIRLSVTQELHEQRVDTIFSCEDSGCGMSEEFLTHIWDSFSQERNKNSDSVKGTGLGMAISKLLVDAMGGDIRVQSELDVGSTFVVTLPSSVIPAQDKQPEPEENFPEADAADHKLRVLLAEDNDLNAEILLEVLRAEGHEGVHASDGQAAVQCFAESEEGEFDLILMDMQMPVMDGCEAAERIRSLNRREAKTIPIFACTANSFKEDRIRAYKSGMTDFLTKPIDVNVLLQKLGGVKPTGMKQDA
jgi:CheY-like chemotaxis protein